jgi:hypothetical protein
MLKEHYNSSPGTIVVLSLEFLPLIHHIKSLSNGHCLFVFPHAAIFRNNPTQGFTDSLKNSGLNLNQNVDTEEARKHFVAEMKSLITAKMTPHVQASAFTPAFTLKATDNSSRQLEPSTAPITISNEKRGTPEHR